MTDTAFWATYMLGVATGCGLTIVALFVWSLGWTAGKRTPTHERGLTPLEAELVSSMADMEKNDRRDA